MEAAKIMILGNNVVHVGDNLVFDCTPTGSGGSSVYYVLRYTFGNHSGQLVESQSYGRVYFGTEEFEDEMMGNVMEGMAYLDTYENDVLIGTTEASFTVAKSTILIPEFSAVYANLGESITVTLNSTSWVYKPASTGLNYVCGDATGKIDVSSSGYLPTTWQEEWTVPLSLGKEFPNQTKFYVEVTVETSHNNIMSGTTSVIGSVTSRLEVRVPENDLTKPTVTLDAEAKSTVDPSFDGLFIRGKTKVNVTLAAASEASEIASESITCGSVTVEGSKASFDLTDSFRLNGTATDVRGYSASVSKRITALSYTAPTVAPLTGRTEVVCARCLADGTVSQKGEFLLIQAQRLWTSFESNAGMQLNKCILRYRIKTASGDYSGWATLLAEDAGTNVYNSKVSGVVLDVKTAYTVQIGVVDTIGESRTITFPVAASGVPFHVGKGNRNVSVGAYCDYSRTDVFDVWFTQYFFTGAAAQTVFEGGSWSAGTELSAAVQDADMTGIGTYNLLIAVSGGDPVLLVRAGGIILGNGIRITYNQVDGVDQLTLQSAANPITALYKLL